MQGLFSSLSFPRNMSTDFSFIFLQKASHGTVDGECTLMTGVRSGGSLLPAWCDCTTTAGLIGSIPQTGFASVTRSLFRIRNVNPCFFQFSNTSSKCSELHVLLSTWYAPPLISQSNNQTINRSVVWSLGQSVFGLFNQSINRPQPESTLPIFSRTRE